MVLKMKAIMYAAILFSFFLVACRKEKKIAETAYSLNSENEDEINNILGPSKKASLILPESNDFASIPQDPKNPLSVEKIQLGQLLFHETRLGGAPKIRQGLFTYSCASCHHAEAGFQSGLAQSLGEGGIGFGITGEARVPSLPFRDSVDAPAIRAPSALNTAFQEVTLWNGGLGATGVNAGTEYAWTGPLFSSNFLGFQGLETQAIVAQNVHRLKVDTGFFLSEPVYKNLFNQAFSSLPGNERISQTTVGLAIAAYERTLFTNRSPFQQWLKGDKTAMTQDEKLGAQLFFGKAQCSSCHNGPALNSMQFFALGMSDLQNGVNGAINIKGKNIQKGRGDFTQKDSDMFKFKVPQLYNLKDVKFFGHGASFTSVIDVIKYLNTAEPQNDNVPIAQLAKEFKPLSLTDDEINKIVAFIENALYDPHLLRYEPLSVPSGNCIPNNDKQSRIDRGCE